MPVTVEQNWDGAPIQAKAKRALGRGLIAIGENVAVEAKELVHVVTGTLRRSIHVAPAEYSDGDGDYERAGEGTTQGVDLQASFAETKPTERGRSVQIIEVGSWIPYACVEECGRGHLFVTPAVQIVQGGRSNAIMLQAFREEGMSVTVGL